MKLDAESYLKSGSNELRVLEYTACGHSFGINILKVQKILAKPECLTAAMNSHPAVIGMFKDNNGVIPLVDLGYFLGFGKAESMEGKKIVVTEFFNVLNGFLVDTVEWIHHFIWEDVINANDVMRTIDQKYIISIVKPDGERMVPLLDYETIILDLCPELGSVEMKKISDRQFDGSGSRILIAEDSPSVRNMLVTELMELGFDVVSAADGKEAMNILENDKNFNLVISDVEMPRMDGLALTTAIRSTPETEKMPVIVYSSIGDIGMKARAEFLKADAHVTKLSVEELIDTVIKFAGGLKIADAGPEIKQDIEKPEEVTEATFEPEPEEGIRPTETMPEPSVKIENEQAEYTGLVSSGGGAATAVAEAPSPVTVAQAEPVAVASMKATADTEMSQAKAEEAEYAELVGGEVSTAVAEIPEPTTEPEPATQVEETAEAAEEPDIDAIAEAAAESVLAEQPAKPEPKAEPVDDFEALANEIAGESKPKLDITRAEQPSEVTVAEDEEEDEEQTLRPTIVLEADRVTVASAKYVTIVDAGNVSIDNVRESTSEPEAAQAESSSDSPGDAAGEQKKKEL